MLWHFWSVFFFPTMLLIVKVFLYTKTSLGQTIFEWKVYDYSDNSVFSSILLAVELVFFKIVFLFQFIDSAVNDLDLLLRDGCVWVGLNISDCVYNILQNVKTFQVDILQGVRNCWQRICRSQVGRWPNTSGPDPLH